jgi:CubicO group peptidase (beta-lactamase class C family)
MATKIEGFEQVEAVIRKGLETTAPAIALTVYRNGEQLVNRAYGYLDPETHRQPAQEDSLFDLASLTKLYTVTAFLMQVSDGRVMLDTPVVNIIPEFGRTGPRPIGETQDPHTLQMLPPMPELMEYSPVDPAEITFRHLLTHTSGLSPWRNLFQKIGPTPPPPDQPDVMAYFVRKTKGIDLISHYPFVDAPGRSVHYSDLGLILLGEAVARLDDQPSVAEVIENRIVIPSQLQRTGFNPRSARECVPTEYDERWRKRRCRGEVHDENAAALGGVAGHAGLFASADDVACFGQSWLEALAGKRWLPQRLAVDAVAEHAVTGVERRGLGWALRTSGVSSSGKFFSPNSVGHTGFTGTSLWIDPLREVVVALMTNRVYHGRDPEAILAFRPAVHDAIAEWLSF